MICGSPTALYATPTSSSEIQQSRTVSGKVVTPEDSMGIPGVSVNIKGTTTGTVTDFDGNYTIKVPSNEAVLVFSYLGYATQEITVGSQTTINVSLESDATALDEIVVVGYGTQKKAVVTGSIDVVKAEVFKDRAISNPVLALQGATPGIVVSRNSSRPGSEGANFLIRGNTSINGGSALIVVDGIPGADFERINPDDIESISILKDASASIYGARAANGVVLVTTKKGKGKMSIDLTSQVRVNTIGIKPQSTSALEYFNVYTDAMQSDEAVLGLAQYNAFGWLSLDNALSIRDMLAAGDEGYINSFWGNPAGNPTDIYITNNNIWDQVYGTSISNQQNISISGANDKIDYRFSAMYAENVGPVAVTYDGQVQYNVRSVVNAQVTDRLKLGSNISFNHFKLSQSSATLSGSAFTNDPAIYPTINPYGQWVSNFNYSGGARQPLANLVDGGRNFEERDRVNLTFDATYKITDHLDFKTSASFLINRYDKTRYTLEVPIYSYDGLKLVNTLNNGASTFKSDFGTGRKDTYGAYFNYKNTFNEDHNVAITTGINTEDSRNTTVFGERIGFEDQGVYNITSASEDYQTNGGSDWHEGLYGILGNVTYDYQNKYLANVTYRRDGSSRFAPEDRWDNFVSGSLGWVITEEKFMENVDFLNFLKLRASYGESANGLTGIGRYDYISTIATSTVLFGDSPTEQTAAYLAALTSRERTWERVEQTNFGLDFRALDNKLSGNFDYFTKQNLGMFIGVLYPYQLGENPPVTNSGDLETKGWEASLTWKENVNDDFKYSVSLFMSDATDEIIDRGGFVQPSSGITGAVEGYPISSLWVYKTDGVFQNQDEVDEYYNTYGTILNNSGKPMTSTGVATKLSPGDTKKVDVNKDGIIDQTDLVYVGDVRAHLNFGINLSANYKGFDFGALFQGVGQQNVIRTGVFSYPVVGRFTNQTDQFLGQTWTPTNTTAAYPRTTTHTNRSNWNWANNDFMVQNNRYIRLKTLTIGYTLPKIKVNNLEFNKIRVYFSGNDLWEASSLNDGYDPEYGSSTTNTYPFTRTWAFGVNVNL
jgi:TonB-linked SusC/RagA family outer membrane protein